MKRLRFAVNVLDAFPSRIGRPSATKMKSNEDWMKCDATHRSVECSVLASLDLELSSETGSAIEKFMVIK
jgi:hypothetical protein